MGEEELDLSKKKVHRKRQSGVKAEKKKSKNKHEQELTPQQRNPKAFTFQNVAKAQKKFERAQELKTKKHHIPVVDRTPLDPPPIIVAVVGGPKVGKSTLLKCLIRNYTKQRLTQIKGPVTIITGKNKKVTFIEVNNDVNCMIDVAKIADIVLILIDATFGIEMEVFEFLEICRAHGTPRIMGILNHLDMMTDNKALKKKKKILKKRFQVELYPGAKLFYLSGIIHDEYMKTEVKNLSRYINVMKFRPLAWRTSHPYILVDRYEDITNPEHIRVNAKCDRDVVLYGYVRGVPLQKNQMVHIPGCGDFKLNDVSFLPDPCPFPEKLKKRSLNHKERLIYAPMSGVGGVVYDKDAVYIDLGGSHHGVKKKTEEEEEEEEENEAVLEPLLYLQKTTDEKQAESQIQLFTNSQFISNARENREEDDMDNEEMETTNYSKNSLPSYETVVDETGRVRRRAIFNDNLEEEMNDESDNESDLDEDEDEEVEDDDEEGESEDDETDEESEEGEDENDMAPPKKRSKAYKARKHASVDIDSDLEKDEADNDTMKSDADSDSDEYDVESDLKNIIGNENKVKIESKVEMKKSDEMSENCKKTPKAIKINKDSEVTSKIQNILDKIKTVSVQKQQPKRIHYDSGFDNDTEEWEEEDEDEEEEMEIKEEGSSSGAESLLSRKQEMKEKDSNSVDNETRNQKDDDNFDYRAEMFKEATKNFYQNQSTVSYLRKYIYGNIQKEDNDNEEEENEEHIGGLFRLASKPKRKRSAVSGDSDIDKVDSSRFIPPILRDWDSKELLDSIRDSFMTGEWDETKNAETLLKMDDEDQDLYGDFEDLETGQKFTARTKGDEKEEVDEDAKPDVVEEEKSQREKYLEKKRRLKEMFDTEYDGTTTEDHFETLKEEMSQQAQLNRSEFEGLDDETRVEYEGFRAGMYVRLEFTRFPCEFITNFDTSYPVIVGGLLENESNMGFVRVRIKVHRWYPKILKNRDPLILSLGWRRFQSLMYYAKREDNFVMRSLKYARKYLHVEAMFWGPVTTVNTGFVALQNITDRVPEFRIAANGVVLEADQSCKIVKKLKLIGHPEKVLRKTAFVKDMFHTETEVAKFLGAKVQTQSGIRGIIKKSQGQQGFFRATFEDVIKMSDVVILKTWVPLVLTKFCSTLRTLLLTSEEKANWQGMKTVAQIKKAKGLKNEVNTDHLYTEITKRREHVAYPLKIPKNLQKALPYGKKPKIQSKKNRVERVLVVKDPHEVQMDKFMGRLKVMMKEKLQKEKKEMLERTQKHKEKLSGINEIRKVREKRQKAAACRKISKKQGKTGKKSFT